MENRLTRLNEWLDDLIEAETNAITDCKLWGRINQANAHDYARQAYVTTKRQVELLLGKQKKDIK